MAIVRRHSKLALFVTVLAISACSSGATEPAGTAEHTGRAQATLLASPCDMSGGNLALFVKADEIGYVGRMTNCTVEPCIFANARDASGAACKVASAGHTITVTRGGAAGTEKMVVDYEGGLFALNTTGSTLVNVTLDAGSKLTVLTPKTGSNMALGVAGLDANTLAARGTARVDIAMSGVDVLVEGGPGNDIFTADMAGWPTVPAGWDTSAHITAAVGAVATVDLTLDGGPGNDTLAGGAGANSLLGGAGNDTFLQSTTSRAETMNGGDGIDTVDYGSRSAPLTVSLGANAGIGTITVPGTSDASAGFTAGDVLSVAGGKLTTAVAIVDTVDGSGAILTAHLTSIGSGYAASTGVALTGGTGTGATLDIATVVADDGALGEGDAVLADVEIVKGGSGNDILSAYAITTTDVVLIGGAGDDFLTGGAGDDDLCGGAGNDRFFDNAGNDNLVGGAGIDTADYSASVGNVVCLDALDQAAGKPCATQNGAAGEKDVANNPALTKVCPRATLTIDAGGTPSHGVAVPTAMQGGAMVVDVENLTGNPGAANALYCGQLPCVLFGGSASDTLWGGPAADIIVGGGGADTVSSRGGSDVIDLVHGGGAVTQSVDCHADAVTLLIETTDTRSFTGCASANVP
jgi:Ca2+-binding RTX toxin-like protein